MPRRLALRRHFFIDYPAFGFLIIKKRVRLARSYPDPAVDCRE